MHVPFNDLGRAIAPIAGDIDMAVSRVVRSGWFLRGEETTAFEREWAAYCGQRFAVACANGTDAITLAAMGIGLKSAWVVGNTCWYTAEGLYRAGVEIGFSDVDGAGRPLGIRGCHVPLFGRFPTGKELGASLYDCAQVAGWRPPAGSVCAWSMYPTKNLGALGDAGVVTTDDEAVAVAIRLYAGADYEWRRRGQLASRMDEVQAAILRVKIPFLDGWNEERRRIAGWYWAGLRADVVEPVVRPEDGVHHLFVVKCGDRHRVQGGAAGRWRWI